MFKQLAYTVAFALSCSLLAALTVVPMLASRLLRDDEPLSEGVHPLKRLSATLGRSFQRLETAYGTLLARLLHQRSMTLGVAALSLVIAVALMPRIGVEYMPQTDESEVRINIEMEPGARLDVLDRTLRRVEAIVNEQVPEQIASETSIGVGWRGGVATGAMQIALAGPRERDRSSEQVAADLRPLLNELPGTQVRTRAGQGLFMPGGGSGGGDGESLEVEIRGFELDRLEALAQDDGNLSGRDLGSVAGDVRAMLQATPMPEGYEAFVGGEFEQQQEAFGELGMAIMLAVVLVYMVLASLYESFRDPLIVMFTVPLSIIGVNLMLFATGTTYNMQSLIGMIMLVGIVVNNSILIVDQTAALRRGDGLGVFDAVVEAGRRRLRPVLMTSLTTTFALLPLALGIGEGAEAQAPMARAVIGGLLSASVVTLLVIPVIYTLLHRDAESREAMGEVTPVTAS